MRLSLSGRIVEIEYRFCEVSVPEFLHLARGCGYDAVELRATQLPGGTTVAEAARYRRVADELSLEISCCMPPGMTADEAGLKRLEQAADLAAELGCEYLKVWIGDVDWLRLACDRIRPQRLTLLAQTHTGGPFETLGSCAETLSRIDRDNFGLQYDPANFFEAEEEYGEPAVRRLGRTIRQLSIQSLRLTRSDDPNVWEHQGRRYERCLLGEPGALDYCSVFRGLQAIGFDGAVTVNEPKPAAMEAASLAKRMHDDLRPML